MCTAGAFGAAGATSLADGPLPIGEVVGVVIIAGSCGYRAYRTIDAILNNIHDDKIFDWTNDGTRIHDDNGQTIEYTEKDIQDSELDQAKSELDLSIKNRKQQNNDRRPPKGTKNDPRYKEEWKNYDKHNDRIKKEERVRDRIKDRIKTRDERT